MATTKKPLTRDVLLVRAAKFRAAIMALVRENPNVSAAEVTEALANLIESTQAKKHIVVEQLKQLVKTEQLVATVDQKPIRYSLPKQGRVAKKQTVVVKAKKGNAGSPAFTIDIVKSTGRVRLQLAGLSIEIGVIDQ